MFRFTIRELVLLTLVVAMGVAWWTDHRRQSRDVQVLLDTMRRETPWLVESDYPDWAMNEMRQEAQARKGQTASPDEN